MPVIPEEMDEFINWDNAAPAMATGGTADPQFPQQAAGAQHLTDMDLALANVAGDDFSYWALEHFEQTNMGVLDLTTAMDTTLDIDLADEIPTPFEESFEIPDVPCTHCRNGGYQCKRICEGKYKGYCTSCVALRCGCSFGLVASATVPTDTAFPYNPWPIMGDHPDAITQEDIVPGNTQNTSNRNLSAPNSVQGDENTAAGPGGGAKIGARFSRESVKILKNWLSVHHKHPYPNEEEKEVLQKQTGLNKTQITNWLANARRRRKIIAPRSTSPGVRSFSSNIDIPQRRGTPASFDQLNPLQRWQVSPPENEPASVTAIARAVTASASTLSSGLNSPYSLNFTDDGSGKSLCAVSSTSSFNTSHSSGGSAFSHGSRGSFGSLGSMNRGRRRRRRKAVPKTSGDKSALPVPSKTFQCTFCTETFRTKHDWQRHEKSLHLSLERWVCAPNGERAFNPENGQISCVFCGEPNPDEAHIETHNHSACQERTLSERTFYRKDHLRQHLKLVHGVKFVNWSMEQWKVATPEIRSRCGFCGIVMDTWTIRVDHLAEHFKTGSTMADWKGSWGFDGPVLDMVENSIPPYLIHDERNSPNPFEATHGTGSVTARNAYELIKTELMFYIITEHEMKGRKPTDNELQLEACRIVFGAEVLSQNGISSTPSWLRDLLLSAEQITRQAQLAPIRTHIDSNQAQLKINGKDNIFEDDPMEIELHEFVKARRLLGLTAMDSELQVEACKIIGRMEESSNHPSDEVANFLLRLIYGSAAWLAGFRQRAVLPRSEDVGDEATRSKDMTKIDSTIHNYSRLESELAEYVRNQRSMGLEPSDADLQKQARIIIYEYDDGWNQTAADNMSWLNAFKQRHVSSPSGLGLGDFPPSGPLTLESSAVTSSTSPSSISPTLGFSTASGSAWRGSARNPNTGDYWGASSGACSNPRSGSGGGGLKVSSVFFADANCYRRLERELGRYVAATMSPNNPNCHVPTDEELQHQSRWILYDDDDPWNQTAADNVEWLRRFKRTVGILTDPDLPGLPVCDGWNATQGGSGFAPPYVYPNPNSIGFSEFVDTWNGNNSSASNNPTQKAPASSGSGSGSGSDSLVPITLNAGNINKPFLVESSTVNKFLRSAFGKNGRLQKPAQVFCSRELENGLAEFVGSRVAILGPEEGFPSDEELRGKAREILGIEKTAAEDGVLLSKFKEMMRGRLGMGGNNTQGQEQQQQQKGQIPQGAAGSRVESGSGSGTSMGLSPRSIEMITDQEVNDILQDLNFELEELNAPPVTSEQPQAQSQSHGQSQGLNGVPIISRGHLMEDVLLADLDF